MRKVSLKTLKGNEILAMDLISESGIILMAKGNVIKKEYISRLKELSIDYLYIEDEASKEIIVDDFLEIQIKSQCEEKVKEILERFTYSGSAQLETLIGVAEDIIFNILEEPEIMYNISGIREKNESTYAHCVNVCTLSVLVSIKMNLSEKKVRDIAIGSLLHDIGYNYIGKDYSDINMSSLTPDEIRQVRKHVIYGYSAVENETWLSSNAKDIILTHHERIDGSGYPFHLHDERIKLESKIVAVCDEFDSKVYGFHTNKMKVHETIEYIMSLSGIKYDFSVVKAFYESVAAYPNGTTIITNQGETGIVLRQNKKCPTRPIVRITIDKDGNSCNDWIEKDLTKDLTLFIEDAIEL